ncbi:hypothetical protein BX616_005405 [Lobosporangium transversale]|nr:hypothetical protein BX616_005405 [Lobosporangium transversale]
MAASALAARSPAVSTNIGPSKIKAPGDKAITKPQSASAKTTTSLRLPTPPKSTTPAVKPTTSAVKPTASAVKPTALAVKPTASTVKPTTPAVKPTTPSAKSTIPKPPTATSKPAATATKGSLASKTTAIKSPGSLNSMSKTATTAASMKPTAKTAATNAASKTIATKSGAAQTVKKPATPTSRPTTSTPAPRSAAAPKPPSASSKSSTSASKLPATSAKSPPAAPRVPPGSSKSPATASKPLTKITPATKPTALTSTTTGAKRPTASSPSTGAKPSVGSASTASRRTPATATAKTTTPIKAMPATAAGSAAKPPAGGRAPLNMTPTTIRTPARTSSTASTLKKESAPGTLKTAATATKKLSVSAGRGAPSPAGSAQPVKSTGLATKSATALELKKTIANIKLDEASTRLQAKEVELAAVRQQLESGLYSDNYAATETASSDGGETLVPEIDLSKLISKDKDVVMPAISAKDKVVTKKKHQIRTLRARIQRLRLEHEKRVKELEKVETECKAAYETDVVALQQKLADSTQKYNDVIALRKKLADAKALHATTIEELNRIHDDKLHSLELELQAFRQEKPSRVSPDVGKNAQDRYRQDLESIKNANRKELSQLLKQHQDEIDAIKAQFEEEKRQQVQEHEAEVKERLDSDLEQIKASQASLLDSRLGAESGMVEVLEQRHARTMEDFKAKLQKDHQHYLGSLRNKHQSEISRLEAKHTEQLAALESKLKTLQEKYESDLASIRSKAEAQIKELKLHHSNEIARRNEKHAAELATCEITVKEKVQRELDSYKNKFSTFVAETQKTQDESMRDLEASYEIRIAELIVEHENHVRELENEANEQVQQEIDRVEMEFDLDRERLAQDQAKKLQQLKVEHDLAIEKLEDQLSRAEGRAKEAIEGLKEARRKHEGEMSEIKADVQAELSTIQISIEAMTASQGDNKDASEALQAGHAAILHAEKSAHELKLSEFLAKKEAAWKAKNGSLLKQVQDIRDQLDNVRAERDRAHTTTDATETRLKNEHSVAEEGLKRGFNSRREHYEEATRTQLTRMTEAHQEHADAHKNKLTDLTTSHHQKLQALKDEQETQMKKREQEHTERVLALQQSLEAKNKVVAGLNQNAFGVAQAVQQAIEELARLKKQNDVLKAENERLDQAPKQLQASKLVLA